MGFATRGVVVAVLALLAASAGWAGTAYDYIWTGPPSGGAWQGSNWNGGSDTGPLGGYTTIPTASVYIGPGNIVTLEAGPLNTWAAAGTLTIDASSQLIVPAYVNGAGQFQAASVVHNAGDIQVGDANGGGLLETGASQGYSNYQGATLDGGGTITLTNGGRLTVSNYGIGTNNVELVNQTVRGDGQIDETNLIIDSPSRIDANHYGATLVMNSLAGNGVVTNNGVMQASNGGILQLGSSHWNGGPITITQGSGGVIQALDGSTVMLGYSNNDYGAPGSVTGGTLTSVGSGHIDARNGFLLDSVTNSADLRVIGATCCGGTVGLELTNTINNTGSISLIGGDVIIAGGGATLTGGGIVTLGGNTISSAPLTNVDNTIQGAGTFWNLGTLNNSGVIDSNATGGTLLVAGANIANSGTIEASNGGSMQLGVNHGPVTITQTSSGVIQALDGSFVQIGDGGNDVMTVTGGTLNSVGTGQLVANHTSLQNLNVSGNLTLANDNTLSGTIHNTGLIAITTAGRNLYLSDGASLTGGGTVRMDGVYVNGLSNGANVTSDNLIHGSGSFGWNGSINVTNQGTIYADTAGTSITFQPGSTLNNQGTVRVAQGAGFTVTGLANYNDATHTLTGGTYNVAGNLAIYNPGFWNWPYYTPAWGATINNNAATIVLDGASSSMVSDRDALAGFADNQAAGSFTILNGRNFTTAGAFSNEGTMNIGGGSTFQVGPSGNLGTYTQTSGSTKVNGTLIAGTLNVAGGTLSGAGTLNASLLVSGTLSPGNSPGTITVNGNYTQTGTLNIEAAMGLADEVIVNGNVQLGGSLDVTPYGTWSGTVDDHFLILDWGTNSESGDFAQIFLPTLTGYQFSMDWEANGLYLDVTGNGPTSGTPEPTTATFLLIGAALLLGGYKLRRSL